MSRMTRPSISFSFRVSSKGSSDSFISSLYSRFIEIGPGEKNASSCSSRTAAGDRCLSRSKERFHVATTGVW